MRDVELGVIRILMTDCTKTVHNFCCGSQELNCMGDKTELCRTLVAVSKGDPLSPT